MNSLLSLSVVMIALCGAAATACAQGDAQSPPKQAAVKAPPGWKLVWSDEFDRDGPPDPKNWNFESGFVRNEEYQWYQAVNARCKKGLLILEGRRERTRNPNYAPDSKDWRRNREFAEYTAASVKTEGKHAWQYGRFEM